MKLCRVVVWGVAGLVFTGTGLLAEDIKSSTTVVTTPPVYVPDLSHAYQPLPEGTLVWDSTTKETNVAAEAVDAQFIFNFTNASSDNVVVSNVRTSCGCTTAQLPPLPWTLPSGTNGQFGVKVNFAGKSGTLFKTVTVTTDKGFKQLMIKITILPPVMPKLSDADRERAVTAAKADRQAVFQGDCAKCHVKRGEGKYGKALYDADCAICHESEHRATMVPDLHAIKGPTNVEFWRTWIAQGKPSSLMPAFSTAQGGPLNDMQIATVANYLAAAIPSQAPPAAGN
jgi:mono/diheme cytochrome c family protein